MTWPMLMSVLTQVPTRVLTPVQARMLPLRSQYLQHLAADPNPLAHANVVAPCGATFFYDAPEKSALLLSRCGNSLQEHIAVGEIRSIRSQLLTNEHTDSSPVRTIRRGFGEPDLEMFGGDLMKGSRF